MAIHLISDLHLSEETPSLNHLFSQLLARWSGKIDALYILGDLFEYWVGDDDSSPFIQQVLHNLAQFARQTPLLIMRGNRDFLLGSVFAQHAQARLLDDPTLITVGTQRYLLSHGDSLCTDDLAYQQFRQQSRDPAWQAAMLARPLAERHAIARAARLQSDANKQHNGLTAISDVVEQSVVALLDAYDWPLLIHGHTHRPACHIIEQADRQSQRWVIPDWHDHSAGYLHLDQHGISARALNLDD